MLHAASGDVAAPVALAVHQALVLAMRTLRAGVRTSVHARCRFVVQTLSLSSRLYR
jgi:hypothetical protein